MLISAINTWIVPRRAVLAVCRKSTVCHIQNPMELLREGARTIRCCILASRYDERQYNPTLLQLVASSDLSGTTRGLRCGVQPVGGTEALPRGGVGTIDACFVIRDKGSGNERLTFEYI